MAALGPGIAFDEAAFEPMRILAVRHALMEHPLLQFPSLVELAGRLARGGSVRSHSDQARSSTDFASAPSTHFDLSGAVY